MKRNFYIIFSVCLFTITCSQPTVNKTLRVKEIQVKGEVNCQLVSQLLEEQTELQTIDVINWEKFPYQPDVKFRIAHSNNQIWLKYYVQEKHILAKRTETNGAVSRDSCVEFFFDPRGDGNYYNFEFSCIGTTHLAYGGARQNRQYINPEIIAKHIKTESSLGNQPFAERTGEHTWEMTIIIPSETLTQDEGIKLKGSKANANFYKCGDDTSIPHYLSWNSVNTDNPDYHQPTYFGHIIFD